MRKLLLILILALPISGGFSQNKVWSIRTIDFANFHYHGSKGLFRAVEHPTDAFTLRNGKFGNWQNGMTLKRVVYGDVTGDVVDEAIVTLFANTEGSAAITHVYIFTLQHDRPTVLWGFEGGDRAWGGLRQAYAQNGQLIVELFGRGTYIGGNLGSTEPVGLCCPQTFTRAHYIWRNGHFQLVGNLEVLPNPAAKTNCPTCMPGS